MNKATKLRTLREAKKIALERYVGDEWAVFRSMSHTACKHYKYTEPAPYDFFARNGATAENIAAIFDNSIAAIERGEI